MKKREMAVLAIMFFGLYLTLEAVINLSFLYKGIAGYLAVLDGVVSPFVEDAYSKYYFTLLIKGIFQSGVPGIIGVLMFLYGHSFYDHLKDIAHE